MGSTHRDDKVLSYGDVVLRRSDLGILQGPHYINDRIIDFYFSFLSATYTSADILLVPPSISFLIANCSDSEMLKDVIRPLDFPSRKIILFTVNDNEDVTVAEGGSHWSLLVYDRERDAFIHHNSLASVEYAAVKLFRGIHSLMRNLGSPSHATCIVDGPTPMQNNGYDCGLFVIAIAKAIFQWYNSEAGGGEAGRWYNAVGKAVTPSSVHRMRKEILMLIESLIEQKK